MKEHLVRVNSVASSSDDVNNGAESVELRARGGRSTGFNISGGNSITRSDDPAPAWLNGRVLVDRRVKPGDTLNKIALQYSVQVADIKRANNLVSETAIFALPAIKVPVSRFFVERIRAGEASPQELEDHFIDPATSYVFANDGSAIAPGHASGDFMPTGKDSDRTPLLAAIDDEDSDETARRARVEAILERTDATVAQVRDQLRETPGLENGAFHFVDATSPDNTMRNIWLLIAAVIFIFVVVPLLLTLLEEKSEAEAELRHHHSEHANVVPPH
uniref:LysM domain-containing protein n=1 Tax=Panagrellus redivivus TaxID=6233 RepID=A0A7E4VFZ0_PANRE